MIRQETLSTGVLEGESVLVSGGAGFIGSSLVERLSPRNDVTVLDDLSRGSLENLSVAQGQVHLVKADVLDRGAVIRATKDRSIVFHLAALTSVPESFERPGRYGDVNVLGTANVLAGALQGGARAVVFASSCAVYGPSRALRIPESQRPNPKSPYAATKLAGEQLCDAAARQRNLRVVKLRIFNAYGPRQPTSSSYGAVIPRFVGAAVQGKPVTIFGSGRQTRDFVFVDDIARAFELAAVSERAGGEVINIGSGRARSVNELVSTLGRLIGKPVEIKRAPRRSGDIERSCAEVEKASRALGFRSEVSFEDGLRRVIEPRSRGSRKAA